MSSSALTSVTVQSQAPWGKGLEALGQASRRFLVGAWVFGFGFHSNPLEVFTVKEKTKIKHQTMFTASSTCRASVTEAVVFPVLLSFFHSLVPGEGRRPFAHMWTLLTAHFLGRRNGGSHDFCLSCSSELEGHVGGFSPGSFPALSCWHLKP